MQKNFNHQPRSMDMSITLNTIESLIFHLRYQANQSNLIDESWEEHLEKAYKENISTDERMISFKSEYMLNLQKEDLKAFDQVDRLRARAFLTNDPVKTSVMLAAATCAEDYYKEDFEIRAVKQFGSNIDKVTSQIKISDKLVKKFNALMFTESDPNKTKAVSAVCASFFTDDAIAADTPATPEQQEFINKVNDIAQVYLNNMLYPNLIKEIPHGVTKPELASLCEKFAYIPYSKRQSILKNELSKYKDIGTFAKQDLSLDGSDLTLSLENGLYDNVKSNEFIQRARDNQLSYTDIEWARGSVDNMLKSAYNDKFFKKFEENGIDPFDGVYIDGVPIYDTKILPGSGVSWKDRAGNGKLSLENQSRMKAAIVAAALDGKKIDIRMYEYDSATDKMSLGNDIMSVKTESSVKSSERFSLRRWFRQLFGLEPKSAEKRIEEANKSHEDTHAKIAMSFDELSEPSINKVSPIKKNAPSKSVSKTTPSKK